jgi:hypothetical protein
VLLRPVVSVGFLLGSSGYDSSTIASALAKLSAALAAAVLAIILGWRARPRPDIRALALLVVLWPGANPYASYYPASLAPATIALLGRFYTWFQLVAVVCMSAAFARFSVLFPQPLPSDAIRADAQQRRQSHWLRTFRLWLTRPTIVWGWAAFVGLLIPVSSVLLPARAAGIANITLAVALAAVMIPGYWAAILNLRASYVSADSVERRRIFWLLEGLLVFVIGFLFLPMMIGATIGATAALGVELHFGTLESLLEPAAMILAVTCIAFAVFYRGALDPSLLLRKTALYSALTIVLIFLFAGLENVMASYVTRLIGWSGAAGTWIAAGLAAAVIAPLHHWLKQRFFTDIQPRPRSIPAN